ncbi:MAG TPA: IS5/IS1182 family transposase, partial [Candidatus Sulfotelmatobacter sp.]
MAGHDRFQLLLVSKSLDDYVDRENPVRFIEAFVDGLGMSLPATSNEMP